MSGIQIGTVTHFFDHIHVAALALTDTVKVGDTVHFLGHSTDFKQKVTSLQIEHKDIHEAGPGDDVAMEVAQPVHPNDKVFRITEEE